jgi:hypothetical protein
MSVSGYVYVMYFKNEPLMVNFKFACQQCQSWQPEMRLDYSGTKIIQSVGNETIEKYWDFLSRNLHWPDV